MEMATALPELSSATEPVELPTEVAAGQNGDRKMCVMRGDNNLKK
jgi:hypothetical protein